MTGGTEPYFNSTDAPASSSSARPPYPHNTPIDRSIFALAAWMSCKRSPTIVVEAAA